MTAGKKNHVSQELQRMKRWLVMLLLAAVCLGSAHAYAAPVVDEAYFFERKNRLEVSASFESLSPQATFGNWGNVSLAFYRREKVDLEWFAMVDSFTRNEGGAQLFTIGAYKDWNDSFYTYTALSAGTNSTYLQKFRVDHDFNFKFGKDKQYIWTLGGSYVQYHNEYRDYILTTGLAKHVGKWVVGYQIFKNFSQPGGVESFSHQISVDYGKEREQWTSLVYSFGKQAYLPTALITPTAIANASQLITLKHRRWLGKNRDHGYFVEVSYFNLEENYHSLGATLGVFKEY